jgi:HlyD family secretion protein
MATDLSAPAQLVIPQDRPRPWRAWVVGVMIVALGVGFWSWRTVKRPAFFWGRPTARFATLEVDRGDVSLFVVENGSLESAENAMVRCRVEALVGVSGAAQGQGGRGGMAGGRPGGTGAPGSGQQGPGGGNPASGQQPQAKAKAKPARPGQRAVPAPKSGATAAQGNTATAAAGASAAPAGATGKGMQGGGATASQPAADPTAIQKPVIRSFTYMVVPHMPLRPKGPQQAQQVAAPPPPDPAQQGGRRNRGGAQAVPEVPGSTKIISILPEGTHVKADDVVCELDSSAFRDELQAQKIRHLQAKAWVEQARSILEVSEISLREFRDGILPQDVQLIRQYIETCRTEADRSRKNTVWSRQTFAKGFRSSAQLKADELAVLQAELRLHDAEGMKVRLDEYTGPKLLKALLAKIEAVRADQLAQQSAFQLESDRLHKLERMVANCSMRAPRDGIVVYFRQSNRWGRVENQIQEGTTVREGQPIFNLPDPKHMQVRATINESKVALIHSGQAAEIRIDAFPDRPLRGTVAEVTPIPSPLSGLSDVRIYYAIVKIDGGGFAELRPGLSAEIAFHVETQTGVTRVPLRAVRWEGEQAYVAFAAPGSSRAEWQWRPVSLGLSDQEHAQVIAGLHPGDRVLADPATLPAPRRATQPARTVARAGLASRTESGE